MSALEALRATLAAEGGLLAGALVGAPDAPTPLGDLAGRGPRAAGRAAEVARVVEAVREGYELHYGRPRVLRTDDADLALLAGDRLYALGLAELAEAGDLHAVAELSGVIALCAAAHARGDEELAEAAWEAGAAAVGWGSSAGLDAAREAARAADPAAAGMLRAAARQLAGDLAHSAR